VNAIRSPVCELLGIEQPILGVRRAVEMPSPELVKVRSGYRSRDFDARAECWPIDPEAAAGRSAG